VAVEPIEDRETYINTLKYALAIAGSEVTLSVRLGVPVARLQIWLNRVEPVPTAIFLDALDVIVAATPSDIARCREAMRKTRAGPSP
jgi:hypothetical protein